MFNKINAIKKFNYKHIYSSGRREREEEYFRLIIYTIYNTLKSLLDNRDEMKKTYPKLVSDFEDWIATYWNKERKANNVNDIIFNMDIEQDYYKAIIYYISGMTDNYAIDMYNNIVRFQEVLYMKKKPSVKKMCENCRIIRRNGKVRVICNNPKHKQVQG